MRSALRPSLWNCLFDLMRLGWILVPKGESNSYVTLPTVVTTSRGLGGIELNYEITLFVAKFPQQFLDDWSWGDSN